MNEGFLQRGNKVWVKDPKDPAAVLDYGINWLDWLDGDTIIDSDWFVSPEGELMTSNGQFTSTSTNIWLSGGLAGMTYIVTNRITTAMGRIQDQSYRLAVKEN